MADIRRKVILEGDASSLVAAGNQATGILDQFGRQMRSVTGLAGQHDQANKRLAQSVEKVRRTVDANYASQKRYESTHRTLKNALAQGSIQLEEYNRLLAASKQHYNIAENAAHGMNRAMRASRFHTANLAAQFFDVGVMMSSGQNPFIMGIQQGSQFSQVMQTMGGTARQQLGALGRAFMQLVNPVTALSVGLVAGVGFLYQWITASDDAEEETRELADAYSTLADQIARAEGEISRVGGGFSTTEQAQLNREILDLTMKRNDYLRKIATLEEEGVGRAAGALRVYREQVALLDEELNKKTERLNRSKEIFALEELITNAAKAIDNAEDSTNQKRREAVQQSQEIWNQTKGIAGTLQNQVLIYMAQMEQAGRAFQIEIEASKDGVITLGERLATAKSIMDAMAASDIASPIAAAAGAASTLMANLAAALGYKNALGGGYDDSARATENIMGGMKQQSGPRRGSGRALPQVTANVPGSLGAAYQSSLPSGGGGGGGGGGAEDPLVAEIERLQESLMTQVELERQNYEERQGMLEEALEKKLITQQEYADLMQKVQKEHADRMIDLDQWQYMSGLEQAEAFFGEMATALASGNEEMMRISKIFGAAEALINAWRTFSQTMADPKLPWFMKLPTAISLLGSAMQAVQAIKGAGKGGAGKTTATGGGVSGPTDAGPVASSDTQPQVSRTLTLIGDRFNRAQAEEIARFMNDGTDDGLVIRGRT